MFRSKFKPSTDGLGTWLFFGAAGLGVTLILVMKLAGWNQVIVTAVPCIILGAYAFVGWNFRNARLRIDQTADNCYYLGFIYTLVSLAYSLYQISDPREDVRSIITNFGIAIASTIVGLVLRVGLSQMRQDPYEIEQQTRTELATTARRLRVQLDQSIAEFSLFGRELRQVLAEGMEETRKSIDTMLEQGMSQFALGVENMTHSIEASNKTFDDRNKAMVDSSDKLVLSISSLGQRIDNVKVSEDLLAQQLGPALNNLFKAAEQIATASAKVADNIKEINFPTEVIDEGLVKAVASLKEGADALKVAAAAESGKSTEWKGAIDNMVAASSGLKNDVAGLEKSVIGLNSAVGNIATGTAAVNQLPASIDAFQKKMDTMIRLMQQSVDQQISLVQRLQGMAPHNPAPKSEPGVIGSVLNKIKFPGGSN